MFVKVIPVCVLFASVLSSLTQTCLAVSDERYAQGMALQETGRWEAALETWSAATDSFQQQGLGDPRIGLAFIELATRKQATKYYEHSPLETTAEIRSASAQAR